MPTQHPKYSAARKQLISFLQTEGFKVHPEEVYCPGMKHCWVDVAAVKGQDYWAFEYKSRTDSIRRGLDQCRSYAKAFNFVVLVADRHRTTSSPYFSNFKQSGFGVWSHVGIRFHPILKPQRRLAAKDSRVVVERQFRRIIAEAEERKDRKLTEWFSS